MDRLQFVAALVSSAVWPFVILVCALIFRGQIAALVDRMRSANVGPVSADFGERLGRAEELAHEITESSGEEPPAAPAEIPEDHVADQAPHAENRQPLKWTDEDEHILQVMLQADSKSAFLFCWARLQMALSRYELQARGEGSAADFEILRSRLHRYGIRDASLIELFRQIFAMKSNVTSYAGDSASAPSSSDTLRFRSIVQLAIAELDRHLAMIEGLG